MCSAASVRRADVVGVAALVISAALPAARADTFEWDKPANGFFATAGNWNNLSGADVGPPAVGDMAQFNEAGSYTVSFDANAASDYLEVQAGNVTFRSFG